MRISTSYMAQMFVASQDAQEAAIAQTQQQISSGKQFSTPAQNPAAASQVLGLQATLTQTAQYGTNANLAQSRLSIEDNTLSSVVNTLQSVRSLALEGANASSDASTRATIATQIQGDAQSLLQLANTQDGNGQYIFGGTATSTAPFSLTGSGVSFAGTQSQRLVQIGSNVQIADGDTGANVFQRSRTATARSWSARARPIPARPLSARIRSRTRPRGTPAARRTRSRSRRRPPTRSPTRPARRSQPAATRTAARSRSTALS
jgi:flagellar hook-associated protein 3 FlgL